MASPVRLPLAHHLDGHTGGGGKAVAHGPQPILDPGQRQQPDVDRGNRVKLDDRVALEGIHHAFQNEGRLQHQASAHKHHGVHDVYLCKHVIQREKTKCSIPLGAAFEVHHVENRCLDVFMAQQDATGLSGGAAGVEDYAGVMAVAFDGPEAGVALCGEFRQRPLAPGENLPAACPLLAVIRKPLLHFDGGKDSPRPASRSSCRNVTRRPPSIRAVRCVK